MIDGGVSIIALIAGFGYAIVAGTSVLFMPVKKIARLDKALTGAAEAFTEVQRHVPLQRRVDICTTHLLLIKETQKLDKTRWGHLKNLLKYMRLKKDVESHCQYVKHYSARVKAEIMLAEAKEDAAKEAAEQVKASEEQAKEERLDILEQDLRDIHKHDGRWTRVKGRLPHTQRSSPTTENLASVDLLNGSTVSLPIPYPVMHPQPSTPRCLPPELEGIVLEGNLIDLSDTPPDLSQREGFLVDLSTDDAENLHRLLSADSESSRLEGVGLLNTFLNSSSAINPPTKTSQPNEIPVSTHISASANVGTDADPVPEPSSQSQSAPRNRCGINFDRLVNGLQMASGCMSTSTDILKAITDAGTC